MEENIIFIGNKPVMNYVLAVVTQFNEFNSVKLRARGKAISRAVDAAEIVRNSFDEQKVDKEPNSKTKRIDPVDAMINAHITQMKFNEKEKIWELLCPYSICIDRIVLFLPCIAGKFNIFHL